MTTRRKLSAHVTTLDMARSLAGALENLIEPAPDAVTQFEDGPEAWRVEAYFAGDTDLAAVGAALSAALGDKLPALEQTDVPDLNWVAISQAALPPVQAGRFVVHGSHDRGRVPHGPHAIMIDAGEAFGTAHHATTLGCLMTIDKLARSRAFRRVLDLGCGSGVLAIAAARALPRADVIATDFDPVAVAVAAENVRANGLHQRVSVICAEGLAHPWIRHAAPFDLVIANILSEPLVALAPQIRRAVRVRGTIILSGLLNSEAPRIVAAYAAQGFALLGERFIAGWPTLSLRRHR
jgi:ribosomal protein L11 methyltransferase